MKNKNLFNKILLSMGIIFIIAIFILFVLGRINREGYLSELSINTDNTLKLNNLDIESTKKLFYINNELDYSLLTNYIFTNSNISNYSYNFRISYYSKVFRNSDIYGVYLNTNSLPNYITEIKFQEKGSPFGGLISAKKIEDDIHNINYILEIKFIFIIMVILLYVFLNIAVYIFIIFNFIYFFKKYFYFNKHVYMLSIFLCFLVVPNVIYKVFYDKFDHFNYENRKFAEKPTFDIKKLYEYPKLYEIYFNDYIPFRNELVQLKNIIDIKIFNNIISDRVISGKNNWLFYKPFPLINDFIGIYEFTGEELEVAKNNLIHFRDELNKKNIDFVLMICPNKNLIYEEKMPSYIKRKTKINSTDKFIEYMNKNSDIQIVYPKEELINYKNKYQLYHKYDTHWNYIGAYIGYSELMKKININVISLSDLMISYTNKVSGDLAMMISSVKFFSDDKNYIITNYNIKNYSILKGDQHFNSIAISDNNKRRNIMFIRDSFLGAMYNYVASYFYKSFIIHIDRFENNEILNNTPNIVVFETVERGLKNCLLNILPSYKIEEINKDLGTNF